MYVKRIATHVDIRISDDDDKSFELHGIPLNTKTRDMMIILRLITASNFSERITFPLPTEWYDHLPFVTNITVHNEEDNLVFTLVYGDSTYQYVESAKDFLSLFDIESKWDEYDYNGSVVTIDGHENIYSHWTVDVEEILITDRKSFIALVDRYENKSVDMFWHVSAQNVITDCALLDQEEVAKLLEPLPVEIKKAFADNVFYNASISHE